MWGIRSRADLQALAVQRLRTGMRPLPPVMVPPLMPTPTPIDETRPEAESAMEAAGSAQRRREPAQGARKRASTGRMKRPRKNKKDKATSDDEGAWEIKPCRPVAPGRKAYKRGAEGRIVRRTGTALALNRARAKYEADKLAPSSRQAFKDRVDFWKRRAEAHGLEPMAP